LPSCRGLETKQVVELVSIGIGEGVRILKLSFGEVLGKDPQIGLERAIVPKAKKKANFDCLVLVT